MKYLLILFFTALGLLAGPKALASQFSETIEAGDFTARVLRNTPAKIDLELVYEAQKTSHQLAQIWGDTILEGDYQAINRTRLDILEELSKNGIVIGYRVTYSQKAWETSHCHYDSESKQGIETCTPGRIVESGFVSKDFKQSFRDENSIAEFFEN